MRTIVSLITPRLKSAIAVIRISGDDSIKVINSISSKQITNNDSWKVKRAFIKRSDESIIDDVLVTFFKAPNSFTGYDVVEISCHGNLMIVDEIIDICLQNGCKLAERGEFTKQAFINNKIDVNQAISINSLINSNSKLTNKISINTLLGRNRNKLTQMRDELFEIIGNSEVSIDYPEYDDIKVFSSSTIKQKMNIFLEIIDKTISSFNKYKYLYNGINVLIIGKTNSGKSSLFNSILKYNRSIVSSEKGTTRDYISESIYINDKKFNFIDTAGFNNTLDNIEKMGIEKIDSLIDKSDLVIYLFDSSKKICKKELDFFNKIKKNKILVKSKSDLVDVNTSINAIKISSANEDITNLIKEIENFFNFIESDSIISITSNDEMEIFNEMKQEIIEIIDMIDNIDPSIDLLLPYLENVYRKIAIILGEEKDFDILDNIFKSFCLGK